MEQAVCSLQGVLAWAKNGDKLFCEKFHAANGKAQNMLSGCLDLFSFRVGGGRFKFSMGSYQVPNMFSKAPHFYPICLGKRCPPFTYIGGLKGRNYIHYNRTFYLEESP